MTDLPSLPPCPDPKGHSFMALWANSDEVPVDYTFACKRCCAIRRVSVVGPLYISRLDDADASVIMGAAAGLWETR